MSAFMNSVRALVVDEPAPCGVQRVGFMGFMMTSRIDTNEALGVDGIAKAASNGRRVERAMGIENIAREPKNLLQSECYEVA